MCAFWDLGCAVLGDSRRRPLRKKENIRTQGLHTITLHCRAPEVLAGKDDFGTMRGGTVLRMDEWRVNVRAEDALARGRLDEEALEFFVKILQHVTNVLKLAVAVGSKTVGKEVGRQETPEKLCRVMQAWRKVWDRDEVRKREELVLPVAVDDRKMPRDWVCVVVRSCVAG